MSPALAALALLAAAGAATGAVVWTEQPELAAAATAAAGQGSEAQVRGDPGLGCFTARIAVPAERSEAAALRAGLDRALAGHGGQVTGEGPDGRLRFVLGRYHGLARLTATDARAELDACMCVKDRYPLEDACAPPR